MSDESEGSIEGYKLQLRGPWLGSVKSRCGCVQRLCPTCSEEIEYIGIAHVCSEIMALIFRLVNALFQRREQMSV